MGVAALVLGIVSVIIAIIPFCGAIAFVPAIIGLILGIVDTVQKSKKQEKKGLAVAGIVLNAIAIVFIAVYTFVWGAAAKQLGEGLQEALANEEYTNSWADTWANTFANGIVSTFNEAITNSLTNAAQ